MENSEKPRRHKDLKDACRTAYLIAGFLKETLSVGEKEELDAWIFFPAFANGKLHLQVHRQAQNYPAEYPRELRQNKIPYVYLLRS